jgi:hypothetical protein
LFAFSELASIGSNFNNAKCTLSFVSKKTPKGVDDVYSVVSKKTPKGVDDFYSVVSKKKTPSTVAKVALA